MPRFDWRCASCGAVGEIWVREAVPCQPCRSCGGTAHRQFIPTVNILVPEHFRHNQRDFLPPKGDPSWDKIEMGSGSQSHAPPSPGEQLARELKNA